jgi:hypothetical protein
LEFVRTKVPVPRFEDGMAVAYTMRPEWFWRFLASNGRETGRSSETYKNRVDCIRSAELTCGVWGVRRWEADGMCLQGRHYGGAEVNVRWIR